MSAVAAAVSVNVEQCVALAVQCPGQID